jgi:hypothetical protein
MDNIKTIKKEKGLAISDQALISYISVVGCHTYEKTTEILYLINF